MGGPQKHKEDAQAYIESPQGRNGGLVVFAPHRIDELQHQSFQESHELIVED